MPLTESGKKILKSYQKQYGKKKGERFFYASIRKGVLPTKLERRNFYRKVNR